MPDVGSLLTAVETKTRSPQTIGLETATPGTGVFHRMFSPVAAFHLMAVGSFPSATPDAAGPRNDGQFCADTTAPYQTTAADTIIRIMDAARLMAYFSPVRLNVMVLPMPLNATPATLSWSIRNVSVVPGCSTTPNVV